jgi:hypothetical protein
MLKVRQRVPNARKALRPALAALLALALPLAAVAQNAFDVGSVPKPDGAEVVTDREVSKSSITYVYPSSVNNAATQTEKVLNSGGWMRYRTPDQDNPRSNLRFKNGRSGIYVSFTMSGGKADTSRIYYSHNNSIPANVPFPNDATDIVYDENRPYLRCVTGMSIDAALEFFTTGLGPEGWSPLASAAIASRWPNARLVDAADGGKRVYFHREGRDRNNPPIALTLQRAAGDKTVVDIRISSFGLPQELALYKEFAGLPAPERTKTVGSTGSADSPRRESHALVIAELPVVLAFYRREMTLRGWAEQGNASVSDTAARLTFTKPDETAVLELGQRYDMTTVQLNAQISQAAMASRERAKKEADAKWMRDAVSQAQELVAASEAKRKAQVAEAAAAPLETLKAMASSPAPIPLPDNADGVKFEGNDGKLDFTSPSTPKSVATFYREQLKSLGWKEERGVINGPTMYSMDFRKGSQKLDMTVMLFGGKAKVSASGAGLQIPADPTRETERLEVDETATFPVPKRYTMSSQGQTNVQGSKTAFRRDYNAQVPSDVGSVLAFYRRELAKREWKELPEGAVVKPDDVKIAFATPEGPAWLKLGRAAKETTVNIGIKYPDEAKKAGILPPPGKAKVVLGNLSDREASVTIDNKTIKVAAGVGAGKTPDGPSLELKPGKYRYVMRTGGKAGDSGELVVAADDAWGLLVGPGGILPLQVY